MFKLDLEQAKEPEIKLPTSGGSSKKQENFRKTSISAILTMPKPLSVDHNELWKILNEMGKSALNHLRVFTPLFLLKLKEIQHAGGKPNQNESSLCKNRPNGAPQLCLKLPAGVGASRPAQGLERPRESAGPPTAVLGSP